MEILVFNSHLGDQGDFTYVSLSYLLLLVLQTLLKFFLLLLQLLHLFGHDEVRIQLLKVL